MERYREELNNIHAPEALILKTLNRVHEEEQKVAYETENTKEIENNITENKNVENIVSEKPTASNNNVVEFKSDNYNYMGADSTPSDKTTEYRRKKSFSEKYGKYIKIGSTLIAAAAVLFLAIGIKSIHRSSYSEESTSYQDSAAPMSDDVAEESDSYSYEDTEAAADEAAYEESEAADESESMEYSESAAEEDSDSVDQSTSDSNAGAISNALYYNTVEEAALYDGTSHVENSGEANDSKAESSATTELAPEKNVDVMKKNRSTFKVNGDISIYKNIQIDEYSQYLGIDLEKVMENLTISESSILVIYDDSDSKLKDDMGFFYINKNSADAELYVSQNRNPAPDSLISGTPSEVMGVTVYAGETVDTQMFTAAFEMGGVNFLLKTNGMDRSSFEEILEELLL